MATFLTSHKLNSEIEDILENATEQIILISPFISLHERYVSVLKAKLNRPEVRITVVFGKNQDNLAKSLKKEDLDFFISFPNIEIRYEKRLHAKYYANEVVGLITSMNLYSYSHDNNIEAGILTKSTLLGGLTGGDNIDKEAFTYFNRVIEQSEPIFIKIAEFESKVLGFSQKYIGSKVTVDRIAEFFSQGNNFNNNSWNQKALNIPSSGNKTNKSSVGYCIRTGKEIQFNVKKPFCEEAYISWLKYKNEAYPEKYCHFTGEPSNGETTFSKPILSKNWQKSMEQNK